MKIIKKETVYDEYKNTNLPVLKYWDQVEKEGTLSKDELTAARQLTNTIYNVRKNKNIDENFVDIFRIGEVKNTCNLASQWGADIGGIEGNGVSVVFMNIEMGVTIHLTDPKSEDANKYLKIFELFNLGLENVEQYRKVLSYYHLDETYDKKPKAKQNKI